MDLRDRTVLVTGGTSGIGLALVKDLSETCSQIIVVARSADKLLALERRFPRVCSYCCDLADQDAVLALMEHVLDTHPGISIVINNAAVQFTPGFLDEEFRVDSIATEINTNLLAPILISAQWLRHLSQPTGSVAIVNISSALALAPKSSSAVYCATKAAIHSVSQALRYQLEATPVRVYEVILPLVDTPMTATRLGKKIAADRVAKEVICGLQRGASEIYIAKVKWLPLLARLSPLLLKKILKAA